MNKEQLIALGLSEEQANGVLEGFKGFIPPNRFNEVNEAKKAAEATIAERDKQLGELKKAVGDNEALKKQIETLQSENKAAKEKYESDLKAIQLNNAVDSALQEAGARNMKAVKALLDMEKVKFDGEKLEGLSDQIASLRTDESSSFMFKESSPKGMTPATGTNGVPQKAYKDMNYSERVAYLEAGGTPE